MTKSYIFIVRPTGLICVYWKLLKYCRFLIWWAQCKFLGSFSNFSKASDKPWSINHRNNKQRNLKSKIKPLCETQWMEKHNHKDLFQLYEPGLNCLVLIQKKHRPGQPVWCEVSNGSIRPLETDVEFSLYLFFYTSYYFLVLLKDFQNSFKDQQLR